MPSQKRKDFSDDEDTPSAYYEPRRSLSPTPSPKRRRCDVLESGMSQLTLGGLPFYGAPPTSYTTLSGGPARTVVGASASPSYLAPAVQHPETPTVVSTISHPWSDAPQDPYVTPILANITTPVVLPGSVEEPTSPEVSTGEAEVADVSMKGPSWYEIEKDRIVIIDLEDSDAEDEDRTATDSGPDAPAFKISSALLDRLPKPHALGALGPEPSPATALVLYRPLIVPAEHEEGPSDEEEGKEERDLGSVSVEELQPMVEEVPMEDTRPCTPMVESVDEPVDEPMDIEML
ncbi:hypothetical protein BD309DRAFT_864375 [Dichomitus squalens]|uniref:Uncharacterized protein n=1 Tax=Dichomitus squalens TaxID=114155 RepID=A0A4V2K9N6_9APHY|nr:hypothetical protein BD309DRAFT_864375 [Dichomitus squalens]TBU64548.1 hypothetical protein BD310DRAFT_944362 [Dichomitus squalens]